MRLLSGCLPGCCCPSFFAEASGQPSAAALVPQIREAKNKQPFMAGLREEIVSSPEQVRPKERPNLPCSSACDAELHCACSCVRHVLSTHAAAVKD